MKTAETIHVQPKTPTLFSNPRVGLAIAHGIANRETAERLARQRTSRRRIHTARLQPNETVESNLPV